MARGAEVPEGEDGGSSCRPEGPLGERRNLAVKRGKVKVIKGFGVDPEGLLPVVFSDSEGAPGDL